MTSRYFTIAMSGHIWNSSPYLVADITQLEKIQRRATKLVHGLKNTAYQDRLKSEDTWTLLS